MTVAELKDILDRVPPEAEVLIGESESAITDTFLPVTGAYRHINYNNFSDSIVLIEKYE